MSKAKQTAIVRLTNVGKKLKGFRSIGPILQQHKTEPLNMQSALETDCETGVRWMNEEKSKELNKKFPTIVAMAGLIEKERDKYKREAGRLKNLMSRIADNHRQTTNEKAKNETIKDCRPTRRPIRKGQRGKSGGQAGHGWDMQP